MALRKRVYAIRKFYEQTLVGEQATRENNPGWDSTYNARDYRELLVYYVG